MRNANPISRPTVMIGLDELARELGIPPSV